MISRIVAFGDSWIYGDELLSKESLDAGLSINDPKNDEYRLSHVFGNLVAKHYDLKFENRGHNAASLQSMMWEFEKWLSTDKAVNETMILVGLTAPERLSWWKDSSNYIHSIQLENNKDMPQDFFALNKYFRSCCSDHELFRTNFLIAAHFFSGMCHKLRIPCVMFNIFPCRFDTGPHAEILNPRMGLAEILNEINKDSNLKIWGEHHPNELGHQLLADWLIQHIDQKNFFK